MRMLRYALGFERVSPLESLLQAVDGRGGNALLFRISFVARYLRIDEPHAKQLILNHFQKRPNFVQAQLHGDLLHHFFYLTIGGHLRPSVSLVQRLPWSAERREQMELLRAQLAEALELIAL